MMMDASTLDHTGHNSYTHSHGYDLQDQPVNSRDIHNPTGGEAFMEFNYEVGTHISNNTNDEYIYGDPSHLSMEDDFPH